MELIEVILSKENLNKAYKKVVANKGASFEPYKRWEFDMDNSNMKGHWTGIFSEIDGQTEIDFTEEVTAKKLVMKLFVKAFLKKQQELYVSNLRKALQERSKTDRRGSI